MNTKNSINESLEVIRRALEDEKNDSNKHSSSNILILNQKVNSDGTIKLLQKDEEINSEIDKLKSNEEIEKLKSTRKKVTIIVQCFRGGMRSKSVAWHLQSYFGDC